MLSYYNLHYKILIFLPKIVQKCVNSSILIIHSSILENTDKDARTFFRITKDQLRWTTGGPSAALLQAGKIENIPRKIAEIQISYFTEKIDKLVRNLPSQTADPLEILDMALRKWGGQSRCQRRICPEGNLFTENS